MLRQFRKEGAREGKGNEMGNRKMPKGFIPLGNKGSWLNVDYVNQQQCYLDKRTNQVAVIDVHGSRYNVKPQIVKGKISYRT